MKSKLLLLLLLVTVAKVNGQLSGGFEHIYYVEDGNDFSMGPIGYIQNKAGWYAEVRYNYEEKRTFSLYVGKVYSNEGELSYAITPMVGGVIGRFKGGSAGLDVDLDFRGFFVSTQSQYTFSVNEEISNFYFAWSEAGYQPLPWVYGGVALQQTYFPQTKETVTHPGALIALCYKNWTLPLYLFDTGQSTRTFICSIIWNWEQKK
ncbi:MAG TPA: hypothetical protein VD816_14800 [Ohtaekwangia sp.]|nr:hypothetical protein [Ohtaekwangia sp.]